jgi:hypothetical protein
MREITRRVLRQPSTRLSTPRALHVVHVEHDLTYRVGEPVSVRGRSFTWFTRSVRPHINAEAAMPMRQPVRTAGSNVIQGEHAIANVPERAPAGQ